MDPLKVIIAILLPPVAVFMETGMSQALLVNVLLTMLGWLPGVIHAIFVLNNGAKPE